MGCKLDLAVIVCLVGMFSLASTFISPHITQALVELSTPPTPVPTPGPVCNNDGICSPPENYFNCRSDCPPQCGNGVCESPDENSQNCRRDCPVTSARLGELRLDKEKYKAGDTVTAYLEITNTGDADITSEQFTITATVLELKDSFANALVQRMSEQQRSRQTAMNFNEHIKPGETKKITASFPTVAYMDTAIGRINLAGKYRVTVGVSVNGVYAGQKQLELELE